MNSNTKTAAKRIWEEGHFIFPLTTGCFSSRVLRTWPELPGHPNTGLNEPSAGDQEKSHLTPASFALGLRMAFRHPVC